MLASSPEKTLVAIGARQRVYLSSQIGARKIVENQYLWLCGVRLLIDYK